MNWRPLDREAFSGKPILALTKHRDPVVVSATTLYHEVDVLTASIEQLMARTWFSTAYSDDQRVNDYEVGYGFEAEHVVMYQPIEIPENLDLPLRRYISLSMPDGTVRAYLDPCDDLELEALVNSADDWVWQWAQTAEKAVQQHHDKLDQWRYDLTNGLLEKETY